MTKRAARIERMSHYIEVLDDDGEIHFLTYQQVSPPLRGEIREGKMVVIEYVSTVAHGAWNIVDIL